MKETGSNDAAPSPGGEAMDRRVFVSPKALIEKYGADGSVEESWRVGRNVHSLAAFLRGLDPGDVVGMFLVEDEERSDPPAEGERRSRMNLLPPVKDRDGNEIPSDRMTVVDALERVMAAVTPDQDVMLGFHSLFDTASARSRFECASIVAVFNGKPAGFSIINQYSDVPASSCSLMYEACRSQAERMKSELRKLVPGIRFSDDEGPDAAAGTGLVLPDGSSADAADRGRVVSPSEALGQSVGTRVVEVV